MGCAQLMEVATHMQIVATMRIVATEVDHSIIGNERPMRGTGGVASPTRRTTGEPSDLYPAATSESLKLHQGGLPLACSQHIVKKQDLENQNQRAMQKSIRKQLSKSAT